MNASNQPGGQRRKLIGGGIALVTAGAIATAVVGGSINPAPSSGDTQRAAPNVPSPAAQPAVPKVASVDSTLRDGLSVFRRQAAPTVDRLPAPPTATDAKPGPGPFAASTGANPSLGRRALVTPSGNAVYLIPSQKGLCLADTTGSQQFCATTSQVLSGNATASTDCSPSLPDNAVEISGVLPDGSKNPTLSLTDGTHQPLDVKGNAYLVRFQRTNALPGSIEWDEASGRHKSAPTVVPDNASTFKCHAAEALAQGAKKPASP